MTLVKQEEKTYFENKSNTHSLEGEILYVQGERQEPVPGNTLEKKPVLREKRHFGLHIGGKWSRLVAMTTGPT